MSIDVEALRLAVQAAMTDTGRSVDYSPLADAIAAEYARLVPAEDEGRHPYTCGICSWGRDGAYHDQSEYQAHMAATHAEDEGGLREALDNLDKYATGPAHRRELLRGLLRDHAPEVEAVLRARLRSAEDEGRLRDARFAAYGHESTCPACHPAEDEGRLRRIIEAGIEAFRLTREYVGEETLPAIEGWSWFDWTEKARAALAATPEPR